MERTGLNELQPKAADYIKGEQIEELLAAAGPEVVRDIFDAFWRTSAKLLDALAAQIDSRDLKGAAASAHAIKGSAANVGAIRVARAAAHLEKSCRSENADSLRKDLGTLQEDFSATRAFAATYLSKTDS
jgi:HPt (histidine-containing phosphotransfer) domain-containing protein